MTLLKKKDLATVFSMANQKYINETRPADLDDKEWITQCYIESYIKFENQTAYNKIIAAVKERKCESTKKA